MLFSNEVQQSNEVYQSNEVQQKQIEIRASSIQKISICPASFLLGLALALEDRLEDDEEKYYAEEGTMLHEEMKDIVELFLEKKKKGKKPSFNRKSIKNLTLEQNLALNLCFNYVCNYIDFDCDVFTERTFTKKEEINNLLINKKGTVDLIVHNKATSTLHIFDYKLGYKKVDVYKNQQLTFYAMLVLNEFKTANIEIENIIIHIIQPRVHNIGSFQRSLEEINNFEISINEIIEKITHKNPEYKPSEESCTYCKCKKYCPNLAALVIDITNASRAPALTQEQKKYMLDNKSLVLKMFDLVEEEVVKDLQNNKNFFNYYLKTKTVRAYNEETVNILESRYGREIYTQKLLGITELERKYGKGIRELPFSTKTSIVLAKETDNKMLV
jgi:hypothetical protein